MCKITPLLNAWNDDLMAPENNSYIIFLRWRHRNEIHMPTRNSCRNQFASPDSLYQGQITRQITRGGKKEVSKRGAFDYGPGAKPPSLEAMYRGSSRTLLHHPHRPCILPDSCVRHSLRVESIDAQRPVFFSSIFYFLLRMLLPFHARKHLKSRVALLLRHIHILSPTSVELIQAIDKISVTKKVVYL